MRDLSINVTATPAVIKSNFEEVRKHLESELQKYDVVVTAETLGDCKKLSTEINKLASEIDRRRKDEVAKASEPVRLFDDQMKGLVKMCKEGRAKLTDQVKQFEQVQLDKCSELLQLYLDSQIEDLRDEFSAIDLPKPKLTWLTASGNLTAAAKSAIDELVSEKILIQSRTDRRLTDLELECRRAGMDEPLERSHIESFLFSDDDAYQSRLSSMIEAELARIERIKAAAEAKAEREKAEAIAKAEAEERRKQQVIQQEQEAIIRAEEQQKAKDKDAEVEQEKTEPAIEATAEPGKSDIVRLQAIFELKLPNGWTREQIKDAYIEKITNAGVVKSLKSFEFCW